MHSLLLGIIVGVIASNAWCSAASDWNDTFYQYRVPLTVQVDSAGEQMVPLQPSEIVSAINTLEAMPFDSTWFAFNHVKVVEVNESGTIIDADVDAGFTLIVDRESLIPAGALERAQGRLDVPAEPGATYLLEYVNEGGGASPVLGFEPLFPVLHKLQTTACLMSHEPRLLPLARTQREVLLVPNRASIQLRVNDTYVTGIKKLNIRRARIAFAARFDKPGKKHLVLYYQPLTGLFLTVPERRAASDSSTGAESSVLSMGPAEKYTAATQYRLPGSDAVSLWFAETTVKLTPAMTPPDSAKDRIRITSAANEAQSFQLVLQSKRPAGLKGVRVEGLSGSSAHIDASAFEVKQIAYVPISEPSFVTPVHYRGPIGDPLVAMESRKLSAVDGNIGIWVTARIPGGTPAGIYSGNIIVDLGDKPIRLPLEIEVYGFELPEFSRFRSSMGGAHITKVFGNDHKTVADYHAVSSKSDIKKLARGYYDEMARNKFTPHNIAQYSEIGMNWSPPPKGYNVDAPDNHFKLQNWDFTEFNRDMQHYVGEMKVNAFTLVHTDPSAVPIFMHLPGDELQSYNRSPQYLSLAWQTFRETTMVGYDKREKDQYTEISKAQFDHLTQEFYRAIAGNLDQHGWLDYAYILSDETAERGYEPYLNFIRLLKSDPLTARIQHVWCLQDSAAFTYRSGSDGDGYAFNNLIDVYLPETNENHHFWEKHYFTDYDVVPRREKLWNYITYSARCSIDVPGINNRAIALEVFKNGGSGFLIWASFIWDSKEHQESNHDNPWEQPYTRWGNGAMAYFYPPQKSGPAASPDFTIVPSLRVETYRESVDDFEYAWLLEKAIAEARQRGVDVSKQQAVLDDIGRFFPESVQWSQNDAWYLELRDRMARAIVQLNSGQ